MRSERDWLEILVGCGVKAATAAAWAEHFAAEVRVDAFSAGEDEIDDFLGQILHESGHLEHLEEGLSYSAERLMQVWPSRFPTVADARPYARSPEALANKVYGGRLGNVSAGDGWKYRGSGPIQITGKDNFAALERATGLPLIDNPERLRQPGPEGLRVCIAWWEGHVPDSVMGNVNKVTKAVNGGQVGLADRENITGQAQDALQDHPDET